MNDPKQQMMTEKRAHTRERISEGDGDQFDAPALRAKLLCSRRTRGCCLCIVECAIITFPLFGI